MITWFWAAGICLSVFVFAGKAGLAAGSFNVRTWGIAALGLLYGVIALAMGVVLKYLLSPSDYFGICQRDTAYGVAVHLFLSMGLLGWGLYMMRPALRQSGTKTTGAGYLLMFPCPLCLYVILMGCSIGTALSGIDTLKTGAIMAGLLMILIAGCAVVSRKIIKDEKNRNSVHAFTGFFMAMTGVYFLLTIMIVPVYSRAREAFSIAANASGTNLSLAEAGAMVLTAAVLFGLGFLRDRKKF